jgi:hypothetical protein
MLTGQTKDEGTFLVPYEEGTEPDPAAVEDGNVWITCTFDAGVM